MADDVAQDDAANRKRGLLIPLVMGVILAVAGGGGGYWAVTSGLLSDRVAETAATAEMAQQLLPPSDVRFVPLETLVISLGPAETSRHLMFTAALEVPPSHVAEVTQLSPRVLDVLNSYLRVVSLAELSDPASLARLRAQMLRRIQIVTGTGRVQDLLVTQFVVN